MESPGNWAGFFLGSALGNWPSLAIGGAADIWCARMCQCKRLASRLPGLLRGFWMEIQTKVLYFYFINFLEVNKGLEIDKTAVRF